MSIVKIIQNNLTRNVQVPGNSNQASVTAQPVSSIASVVSAAPKSAPSNSNNSYAHDQMTPSAVWAINHKLGYNPNATVVDSSGSQVIGEISYVDVNNLTITFSGGFSGKAYLS